MKKFALAGACALAAAGAASADFTNVSVMSMGEIIPGTTTYRIFANFDNVDDKVLAVSASQTALRWSGAELVQNAPGFESLDLQDKPFAASLPGDSWVTIGGNVDAGTTDTTFSPGFLSPAFPGASVINGDFFEQLENGGYFDFDPGTAEAGGSVIIAQFTIAADAAGTYEGTVDWQGAGAGFTSNVFSVVVPAPGAVALLGLAGLAGTRRRRG